jgi:hypothetical protein
VRGQVLFACSRVAQIVRRHLGAIVAKGKSEAIEGYEVFGLLEKPLDTIPEVLSLLESDDSIQEDSPNIVTSWASGDFTGSADHHHNPTKESAVEVAQLYKHRGEGLLNPSAVVEATAHESAYLDGPFVVACMRNDSGLEAITERDYEFAAKEFNGAQAILSTSKAARFHAGFAGCLEHWFEVARNGLSGEVVDTVFVAKSK